MLYAAPIDEGRLPPAAEAASALEASLGAADGPAAEAAAVALLRAGRRDDLVEALALPASRDLGSSHNAIFADHLPPLLAAASGPAGETIARALVRSVGRSVRCAPGRPRCIATDTSAFEHNRALAGRLPPLGAGGRGDAEATRRLLRAFRVGDQAGASEAAAAALREGAAPATVWDAVLLYAAEQVMNDPDQVQGLRGVHALTSTAAHRRAFDRARSDERRRLLLLQAASNVTRYRPSGLQSGVPYPTIRGEPPAHTLDDTPPLEARSPDEVLEALATDRVRATRLALGLAQAGSADALLDRVLALPLVKGNRPDRSHDLKFHEALAALAGATTGETRALLVAATVSNAHPSTAPPWPRLGEAMALLATVPE